jgi:DNA-binding MarR family transcriptional regulator
MMQVQQMYGKLTPHGPDSAQQSRAAAAGATIDGMATTPTAPAAALDQRAREAWAQAFSANRAITREVEKRLQEAGLPPLAWYDVMSTLFDCDEGKMKQTALAARVQVSPSGLSRLIDRMVAKGVVERREVPGDRRAAELVVTSAGTALLSEVRAVYTTVLEQHFAPAVAGHEAEITKVFGDTADSLQGICETRIAEAEAACEEAEAAEAGA